MKMIVLEKTLKLSSRVRQEFYSGLSKNICNDLGHVGEICDQPRIIIIGGGIAGLSAAQRLLQCGLTDVTILEGSKRIGGRVHTIEEEKCKMDLGAQYIYGSTISNPIFNIAVQEDLIKHPISPQDPYRGYFFTSNGLSVDPYVYEKAKKTFQTILQKAYQFYSKQTEYVNNSVWSYFLKSFDQELKNKTSCERKYSKCVLVGMMNDLKTRFGADLNEITLGSLNHSYQIAGGDICLSNFSSILNAFEKIPKKNIKLEKKVRTIKWSGDPRVEVCTEDGANYSGDYVIVTVSLGVLKNKHEELFSPTLPANKIQAIENIGFGHVNKVFLIYEKPFWVEGEAAIRTSWSYEEINNREWIHSIGIIEEAPECPNVLMFEIGGTEAMYLEKESEREINRQITCLLRKLSSDNTLPEPKKIVKSSWSYDPLFYGSKSFLTSNTYPKHINDLINPIPDIIMNAAPSLFFAGEGTSFGHLGTVHGACLSGVREAEAILALTKRFRGRPPMNESMKDFSF